MTKGLRYSVFVYATFLVFCLIIEFSVSTMAFVGLGAAIVSIFYFNYFKDLRDVYLIDDGIEFEDGDGFRTARFDEIKSIEGESFSSFYPTTISIRKYGSFTILPADALGFGESRVIADLKERLDSNKAVDSMSAAAPIESP